jgi:hypothetical protein
MVVFFVGEIEGTDEQRRRGVWPVGSGRPFGSLAHSGAWVVTIRHNGTPVVKIGLTSSGDTLRAWER